MNIYICSTVRHLLFALCRGSAGPHEQHHILFFADYQGASLADWNLADIPRNIHVYEMARADFRRRLESSFAGRLSYQWSRAMLSAPAWLRQPVIATLAQSAPDLARDLRAAPPFTLWLFNERNRMARVFRLLTLKFNIIDDGESNYLQHRLPWWKAPPRLLRGLPARYRCFGDDPRCREIWVIYPEHLAPLVRGKGQAINFLTSPSAVDTIRKIMGGHALPRMTQRSVILATQPLDVMAGIPLADKQRIYETIVTSLESQGRDVVLKVHPAENAADYAFLHGRAVSAPAKVPVEALILSASEPPVLLSIGSSAGLGFERFCTRIRLIENKDFATVRRWARQPEELRALLDKSLPQTREGCARHGDE